jgi:HK97 family phage portal protein
MSLAQRFFSILGGGLRRDKGIQAGMPLTYPQNSAATVNFDTAMTVSAFWASARLLSETVAAMPLVCYEVRGSSRKVTTNYKLWWLLNYMPNRYQTRTEFWECLMLNLVTSGNWYCSVMRNTSGEIISLMPLMSSQMTPRILEDGTLVYEYRTETGVKVYSQQSIWHVKLFGNGIVGLSPLGYARQSIGTAIALENRTSTLAANGGKTTGILTIDKVLTSEQRQAVRKNFESLTDGGHDGLFVLEAGMNYQQTSLTPADMQMLESRKYQVEDIARFMGVPSVLINDTSGTTTWGSGVQQIIDGFYKLNLRPYLERIESSITKSLMQIEDWSRYEIQFDFDSLLRADKETRFKTLREGVNAGIITPNEARADEGLEPKTGGDDIYLNGTMVPAGKNPQVMK